MGENQERLARLTGISPAVQDEIWKEVKANQQRLEECIAPHDFSICLDRTSRQPIAKPTPQQIFGAKWRCSKCQGVVDGMVRNWYNKGLLHGIVAERQDRAPKNL